MQIAQWSVVDMMRQVDDTSVQCCWVQIPGPQYMVFVRDFFLPVGVGSDKFCNFFGSFGIGAE